MRKLMFALGLLPSVAFATAPPDVPAYVAQTVAYAAGSAVNTLGDGSANGGVPPAMAYELADIPSTATGWVIAGASYVNGPEPKFRSHANITHIEYDDPIRNYGAPGASHLHEFFGNAETNAYSTFASLRRSGNAKSLAGGGPYNATGYWFPCPVLTNPFSDGKNYCVKADYAVIYYTNNDMPTAATSRRLPLGLRYVTGTNMDDPDDNAIKAEVAAANAQPGTSGRYSYSGNGDGGWSCYNAAGNFVAGAQYLMNTDGSDPFGGLCTGGTGWQMIARTIAPECWDGVNFWSPGGYKHMRHLIQDNNTGHGVCPLHWYRVPQLQISVTFSISSSGFADYKRWRLSSDDMAATAAGHAIRNGESFHTDWLGGWDKTTFLSWQQFCDGTDGNTGHTCNDGTINATQQLIRADRAPNGRYPQVDLGQQYFTTSAANMFQVPANPNGPATMHMHGY